MNYKKLICVDVDGVLIDSRECVLSGYWSAIGKAHPELLHPELRETQNRHPWLEELMKENSKRDFRLAPRFKGDINERAEKFFGREWPVSLYDAYPEVPVEKWNLKKIREELRYDYSRMTAVEPIVSMVRAMKDGYPSGVGREAWKVVIVTAGSRSGVERKFAACSIADLLPLVLYAGVDKTHTPIWEDIAALVPNGRDTERVVIDDDKRALEAASRAGFRPMWFNLRF